MMDANGEKEYTHKAKLYSMYCICTKLRNKDKNRGKKIARSTKSVYFTQQDKGFEKCSFDLFQHFADMLQIYWRMWKHSIVCLPI